MATVLDATVVVAVLAGDDPRHEEAIAWLATCDDELVTTPVAAAEMDYFAQREGGAAAQSLLWADFENGAYGVRWWADAMQETVDIARRWAYMEIGLADASLVALAGRLRTERVATFDQRHFRHMTTTNGEPFVVLPADAS